ncbi:MAG: hypothetical protein AB7I04_01915 [Pseudomonadales bacterium]
MPTDRPTTAAAPEGGVSIRLLGPLTVTVGGAERELPKSRKTRALLAMLALEPGPHQRSTLCDWIWPDTADPRGALRWSLTKLREVLDDGTGDVLVSTRDSVSLDASRVSIDVSELRALLSAEPAGRPNVDPGLLTGFARRFDRSPLPELDTGASSEFELWLESQRSAIQRLHQQLLETLVERLVAEGDATSLDGALDYARQRVTLDPFDNRANADLLRLLFRRRGRDEAREALERTRRRLLDAGLPDTTLLADWRAISAAGESAVVVTASTLVEAVTAPELPSRPSVAVLAFEDLGGHESGGVLAEGISTDLNTRLAQLRGLFVVARASARRFSLNELDARTIGARLGVRYLVHGTTQRTPDRLRVTANLIEAEGGGELWSERFDRPLGDLFEVQDDLADAIVSELGPQIDQAEMDRVRRLPTENLDAWECFHRAMWHSYRFTPDDNELAHGFFRRALLQDPQFARAHAGLSFNHFSRAFLDATDDVRGEIGRAIESGELAVTYDSRDAMGHWALGRARFLNREHDAAMAALDRALLVNPNYAQGHYSRGFVGTHSGLMLETIDNLSMAERLSPFDPMLFGVLSARGISLTIQGRLDEGAEWALRATREPNAHFYIYAIAAASLELAGRHAEAEAMCREVLARRPDFTIEKYATSFPFKDEAHHRIMSEAIIRAWSRLR